MQQSSLSFLGIKCVYLKEALMSNLNFFILYNKKILFFYI